MSDNINSGVYMVKCMNGYIYIGESEDLSRREEQHKSGEESNWLIKKYKFKEFIILENNINNKYDRSKLELFHTLKNMEEYGINKVKGACFCDKPYYWNREKIIIETFIDFTRSGYDNFQINIHNLEYFIPEDFCSSWHFLRMTRMQSARMFFVRIMAHLKNKCFKCLGSHYSINCNNTYKSKSEEKVYVSMKRIFDILKIKDKEIRQLKEENDTLRNSFILFYDFFDNWVNNFNKSLNLI